MVTVLAIADEEAPGLSPAALRRMAPGLVLAAGDLSWRYLEYVASATDAPLVFVPGNHDPAIAPGRRTRQGTWVADGLISDGPRPHGGQNVDGTVLEVAGLRIAGLGGCVRYNGGPHQYTQRQYLTRARRLRRRAQRAGPVDVLLTHAPPRGLGDQDDACHIGIDALPDLLDALTPTWHLHGHIHPHGHLRPDRTLGPTTLRNVIPFVVLDIAPRWSRTCREEAVGGRRLPT